MVAKLILCIVLLLETLIVVSPNPFNETQSPYAYSSSTAILIFSVTNFSKFPTTVSVSVSAQFAQSTQSACLSTPQQHHLTGDNLIHHRTTSPIVTTSNSTMDHSNNSNKGKGFLFIPSDESGVAKGKKPVHLDRRFSTRNASQPNNGGKTSPTSSGKISPTSMKKKIDVAHRKAQEKRAEMLEERRKTLARKSQRISEQVKATEERQSLEAQEKKLEIESNLLVAEKNREEILQGIVESAASNVKKAKELAHVQQQKEIADSILKKELIDRKISEVNARRRSLLKIPRSKLMEVVDSSLAEVPSEAATVIQTTWRSRKFRALISNYNKTGLRLDNVSSMQFEDLAAILASPEIIANVNALLDGVKSSSPAQIKIKNGARIFLTAYVIVCHSDAILMESTEKEAHLQAVAKDMLVAFEEWIASFRQNAGHSALKKFLLAWQLYHRSFESWKTKDRSKYINQLIENFLDLQRLWNSVQSQVDAETQWRPKIEQEKVRLRSELNKIGGKEALQLLSKRIEKMEQEEPTPMDTDPVESEPVKTISQSPSAAHLPASEEFERNAAPKHSAVHQAPSSASNASSAGRVFDSLNSFAQGTTLSNEILAHELMLDPTFEIQNFSPENFNPQLKQIKETAKKAFFDTVRQEFSEGKFDHWLPLLLGDIKSQLLSMLPNETGPFARQVQEALDLDFIRQQIQNNVFEMDKCFAYVIGTMKKLCAPIRDQEIRDIEALASTISIQRQGKKTASSPSSPSSSSSSATPRDLVSVLERMLALLDDMKLDLANFRLIQLRPILKEHIVSYEREKFQAHLDRGDFTLEHAQSWLNPAVEQAKQVADERNPENIDSEDNKPKYLEVYADALLKLLTSSEPIGAGPLAETLRLDHVRLSSYQNEIQALTIVAAINMLLRNSFPVYRRDTLAHDKLRDSILVLLMDPSTKLEHIQAHVIETIRKCKEGLGGSGGSGVVTDEERTMLQTLVDKTLSTKDTVFSLLQRRIASIIKIHLVYGKFRPENLPRHGLDIVGKELALLSEKIFRFSQHNRDVYAPYYDKILQKAIN